MSARCQIGTSGWVYPHWRGIFYAGQYGQVGLQPWAERIQKWLAEGHTVYAYFNNDAFGHAVEDAQMLREMVGAC